MASDHVRLMSLRSQIEQMRRDIAAWQVREVDVSEKLAEAMFHLEQYGRWGHAPDPVVQSAVNNHSVELNHIRNNLARINLRKSHAEQQHLELSRRLYFGGY